MSKSLLTIAVLSMAFVLAAHAEDKPKPPAATDTTAAAEEAFTPPPGWREKKRGKFTVYCQKQAQMGSRVPTEVCYDETGIRAMLAAQAEDREKADQMRRICGSQAACGSN